VGHVESADNGVMKIADVVREAALNVKIPLLIWALRDRRSPFSNLLFIGIL